VIDMAQTAPARTKIPTSSPQLGTAGSLRPARRRAGQPARSPVSALAAGRATTRSDDRMVVELEYGVTVYPAWRRGPVAGGVVRGRAAAAV
jgi:hypothetical protein